MGFSLMAWCFVFQYPVLEVIINQLFIIFQSSPTLALKLDGRTIYYAVADDDCEVPDEFDSQIHYQGHDLDMLIKLLKTETGIEEDIYVCAKNHINNKLFPLLLRLPPNNAPMYVVVVKASSKCKYF